MNDLDHIDKMPEHPKPPTLNVWDAHGPEQAMDIAAEHEEYRKAHEAFHRKQTEKPSEPLRRPQLIDASDTTLSASRALRIAKSAFTQGWYAGLEDSPPDVLFRQWWDHMGGSEEVNDIIKSGEDTPS